MFHPPRFLQTIHVWSLPALVLVLSVLTLFALMKHAKPKQIKLGSTIHTTFTELQAMVGPSLGAWHWKM
jgi:cytochrome c-type biogenesis protein CcmH/NrfF